MLTDFGTQDEFAGVLHRVVLSIAPEVQVVVLSHQVPRHDVRAGAAMLQRALPWLAPAVVLAVVDPGVGTDRRAVAVELGDGTILVGPDNGLLAQAGGAARAVELTNPAFQLAPAGGRTFAGRDVFAPAAAHICAGADLGDLGPAVATASLVRLPSQGPRQEGGAWHARVTWVDRFGNAQLNLPRAAWEAGARDGAAWEAGAGARAARGAAAPGPAPARVSWAGGEAAVTLCDSYATIPAGTLGLVEDSYGMLSLCLDRGSAAERLGLVAGEAVWLRRVPSGHGAGPEDP